MGESKGKAGSSLIQRAIEKPCIHIDHPRSAFIGMKMLPRVQLLFIPKDDIYKFSLLMEVSGGVRRNKEEKDL
jgi:hypothetical protein